MHRRKSRLIIFALAISILLTGAKFLSIELEKVSKERPFVDLSVIIKEGGNGDYPEESLSSEDAIPAELDPIVPLDPIVLEPDDSEKKDNPADGKKDTVIIPPKKTSISIEIINREISIDGKVCEDFESFKTKFGATYTSGMSVSIANEFAEYHTCINVAEFLDSSGIKYTDSFKGGEQ